MLRVCVVCVYVLCVFLCVSYEARLVDPKLVVVTDCAGSDGGLGEGGSVERLEFPRDRVVDLSLGWVSS